MVSIAATAKYDNIPKSNALQGAAPRHRSANGPGRIRTCDLVLIRDAL